mgnify:CR=1 FL=1
MKRTLLALAALATAAGASAQSSNVTLFGVADVSVAHISTTGKSVSGLANGTSEIIRIDGVDVALTNGNSVTTAAIGYNAAVALAGEIATVTITKSGDYTASQAQSLVDEGIRPQRSLSELAGRGVTVPASLLRPGQEAAESKAALVDLVSPEAPTEYWLGFDNFYVITRYNRSSFYAMSVFMLAESLREAQNSSPPAAS